MIPIDNRYIYKYFNDYINGAIGVSETEAELIDTNAFQRLRKIGQTGLNSYVFIGTEHSRFVHSIGTLHTMGKMCLHLKSLGEISDEEEKLLRIAALLHDIGHYPFSHLGEAVYMSHETNKVMGLEGIENDIQTNSSLLAFDGISNDKVHHERLGSKVITGRAEIYKVLEKSDIDPNLISHIINGEAAYSLYSQLMHSSLDCDRLDYLPRDSYLAGVNYGKVDVDYLIRLLRVVEDPIYKKKVLAIEEPGLNVVEHFLMARYFHYQRIIGHKTTRAFECVAKALLRLFLEEEEWSFSSWDRICESIDEEQFLDFNDSYVIAKLACSSLREKSEQFKQYYDVISNRKRPCIIWEERVLKRSKEEGSFKYDAVKNLMKKNLKELADILNVNVNNVGWHEANINMVNEICGLEDIKKYSEIDKDYLEAIRICDKTNKKMDLLIEHPNSIISRLAGIVSQSIIVFYLEPNENKQELTSKKKKAISYLKSEVEK